MLTQNDYKTYQDNELLEKFIKGDHDAFAALLHRYEKPLYAFLYRFTNDHALAEDIFQNTFMQIYRVARSFDGDRQFRPWLYTIAANKARDALRKRNKLKVSSLDANISGDSEGIGSFAELMPSKIPSPDEISVNLETTQAVQSIVEELPDHLRVVLTMAYFGQLPQKRIAEILEIPVGTVKSRLHHAVKLFAGKWKAFAENAGKNVAK